METVPQHPADAGKVSRGEAGHPKTAAAQRQVLGAGVTVLMTVGETGWGRNNRAEGLCWSRYEEATVCVKKDAHEESAW